MTLDEARMVKPDDLIRWAPDDTRSALYVVAAIVEDRRRQPDGTPGDAVMFFRPRGMTFYVMHDHCMLVSS